MLSYYGISYGTQLGSTYAAMFPSRVRSMVLDAVLDPVAWTAGRFGTGQKYTVSARLDSGYGAWEALTSALAECDRVGHRACPQAGHIAREWERVVAKLRTGAVRANGQRITYANVIATLLGGSTTLPTTRPSWASSTMSTSCSSRPAPELPRLPPGPGSSCDGPSPTREARSRGTPPAAPPAPPPWRVSGSSPRSRVCSALLRQRQPR